MQNYYELLGVSRDATPEEIRNAYRSLAKKYHPDSSDVQKDKEQFQKIQEAYAVLSSESKRKVYDSYGHEAYQKSYYAAHPEDVPGQGKTGHTHGCGRGESCDGDCENCEHHEEDKKGEETWKHVVRLAVWLEMEETFREVVKDVVLTERFADAGFSPAQKETEKRWRFSVRIPANTYEKQNFPLEEVIIGNEELIEYLHTAYPDNCYVVILLLRDKPGYTRQAFHLYLDYTVDFHTLVLGGRVKIPSVTGEFLYDIPAGTSPERKLRIPNKGLNYPPEIGKRGDLYLNLHVRIPRQLTDAQRKAFETLRSALECAN